jgi:hypothetical protein
MGGLETLPSAACGALGRDDVRKCRPPGHGHIRILRLTKERCPAGILRGMSAYPTKPSRLPSPWLAGLVFLGALLPGLVALLPLTLGAGWYLAKPSNALFLTDATV